MTAPSEEHRVDEPVGGDLADPVADDVEMAAHDAAVVAAAGEPVTEPVAQVPLVPTPPPSTGEPRVDEAVERLVALEELPVTEHVAVFDETHRMLQDALADLDEG